MCRQGNVTVSEVLIGLAIAGLLLWGVTTILWRAADAPGGGAPAASWVDSRPAAVTVPARVGVAADSSARTYWSTILQVQWQVASSSWAVS